MFLVASKPYIYEHFQALVTQAGPRVSLKCAVVGTPAPVVIWTLDGSSLSADDRIVVSNHSVENGDVISVVNVIGIRLQDGGLYRCTAKNDHGTDTWEARIDVYGRILKLVLLFHLHIVGLIEEVVLEVVVVVVVAVAVEEVV